MGEITCCVVSGVWAAAAHRRSTGGGMFRGRKAREHFLILQFYVSRISGEVSMKQRVSSASLLK